MEIQEVVTRRRRYSARPALLGILAAGIFAACAPAARGPESGIGPLPQETLNRVDSLVGGVLPDFAELCVGLVKNGSPVLAKAFGAGTVGGLYAYASVSKPVTSIIVMRLVREGKIRSLDDDIGEYSARFRGHRPEEYRDVPLTFRHLLLHTSGLPHLESPWAAGGVLDLRSKPGSRHSYSTVGYGILGQVMSDLTGLSFDELLQEHIAEPVGARSFQAPGHFIDPGAFVQSDIGDMALFAAGVLDGAYLPLADLEKEAFVPVIKNPPYGLGWGVENEGTDGLIVFHGGSNGLPKAYLILKPHKKTAVCLLGICRASGHDADIRSLGRALLEILE
jgi:CubicO group peptidase (beta-lactamase class C family)